MWRSVAASACHTHQLPSSALKFSSSETKPPTFLYSLNITNRFNFISLPPLPPPPPSSSLKLKQPSTTCNISSSLGFVSPINFRRSTFPKRIMPISTPTGRASCSTESNSGGGGEGREILVQHLLVKGDNLKLLLELQERTIKGEDLSDLAVEYSTCPSKEKGGMLGWVRKGQMVPEFEEAAFNAPLNRIVRCQTKFGWHLLQVLSEREEALLKDIQPEDFHIKMQDPTFLEEAQLVDVREPEEVSQASLPGFQVFPLRQFGSWGSEITTKLDSEKDTYVLCHHGMRSLQVAKWLQAQGFKRVFNIGGGIHAYATKVDPSIPTY